MSASVPLVVACMMVSRSLLSRGSTTCVSGVAEAAVVFDDLRAVGGEHQAEVKAALERCGLRLFMAAMVGRKISSMHRSAMAWV